MRIFFSILLIITTIACQSSGTSSVKKQYPTVEEERPLAKAYCTQMKDGLQKDDPMFNLKGKIHTFSGAIYEVEQFGKKGQYREYFVSTPRVPNLYNYMTCGSIALHQVAKIEVAKPLGDYSVTLKNGKKYSVGNTSLSYRHPDNKHYYTALSGIMMKGEENRLCFLAKDKRFSDIRELCIEPNDTMKVLEIY